MEFHPNQVKNIKTMLVKHGLKNFTFYRDQYNRYRYVIIII